MPAYRGLYRTTKVPACVVNLQDIRRLYSVLDEKTVEALERRLGALPRPAEGELEKFEELKRQVLVEERLTVTVQGADGEQLVARFVEGLDGSNLPDRISWITFDSAIAAQAQNIQLLNRFTLRLDFTEPPSFHSYNPWDEPTPNNSHLEITGSDQTWVTGVYESTLAFFRKRRR